MIATACKEAKKVDILRAKSPIFCNAAKSKVFEEYSINFDQFTQSLETLNGGLKTMSVAMATIDKTLFAHFR